MLHQHFLTPAEGGAIRSYYLAKALVDAGIKTVVVTGSNRPQSEIVNVEGIEVHYLPIPYQNGFHFYQRIWSFIKYISKSLKKISTLRDVDVCYAISVPLTIGLVALRIKSKFKIPYLFEVGDLWPDAPIEMGFIKNAIAKKILYSLEHKIYKNSLGVVALSTAIQDEIRKKVRTKHISLIPNFSDTEFYLPTEKNSELEIQYNVEDKFVVSYVGAHGYANGLINVLQNAKLCQEKSLPVHFVFCGAGAKLENLKLEREALQLNNVSILGFRNREGVKEVLNITDAAFISFLPFPILETGSPNKYFDGLSAGKLIITNFKGWVKQEIESEGCGFYASGPQDFIAKLLPYLENHELLKQGQQKARQLAERKYSRSLLGNSFVELIRSSATK
jgi:glycosyltransferase involved in cell wall biosynthesis